MIRKHIGKVAIAAALVPVLTVPTVFAGQTAEQQLRALTQASNKAPYVQSVVKQSETVSVSGKKILVTMTMNVKVQHTKSGVLEQLTMSVKAPGTNTHQSVFVDKDKEYVNAGSGWQLAGTINPANLQQLTMQSANMLYQQVSVKSTKSSQVFNASLNPKTFAAVIQQALASFTPTASSSELPSGMAKVMADMFKSTKANMVITAVKQGKLERLTKEFMTMHLTITRKEIAAIAGAGTKSQTVTSSVYGKSASGQGPSLPKSPISITLVQNAEFTYRQLPVNPPKGL